MRLKKNVMERRKEEGYAGNSEVKEKRVNKLLGFSRNPNSLKGIFWSS